VVILFIYLVITFKITLLNKPFIERSEFMKFKRKLFNILSTVLVAVAYISTSNYSSILFFGESEIPDELIK
jgi:cyclic lactone autoinducer peptide